MKFPKSKITENKGLQYLQEIVNEQGSILRPVHQETDIGIDAFIELVEDEKSLGRIVAIQVKSGDSYYNAKNKEFQIRTDQDHLDYWKSFMVPVLLIAYSPTENIAGWVSVRDFIEYEKYHGREAGTTIKIPTYKPFNIKSFKKEIFGLAHVRADERMLLQCADNCLSEDSTKRYEGFYILSQHPDSRKRKITCSLARQLIMDENKKLAKDALFILGYGVGRIRWSWNPNNTDEKEVIRFATTLCEDLTEIEIKRLVKLIDDEFFGGPDALGERCFDVLNCSELAPKVLEKIALDNSEDINRRVNCLYMLYGIDDMELEEEYETKTYPKEFEDLFDHIFKKEDNKH